jgi:RHS repeat-associated protein
MVKSGSTVVASYQYDALNRRVKKIVGSETRLFYYNQNWQCLEEYVGSDCNVRFVWGLRYVDDLVTYRNGSADYHVLQDANWNVVALTNVSGVVQERYTYASFGKLNVFDASFMPKSASIYNLTRSFTGQVLDNETGLMLYRNRGYHPMLGKFLQRDPIGYQAGDLSLMRYVGNRVNGSYDSKGLNQGGLVLKKPERPYPTTGEFPEMSAGGGIHQYFPPIPRPAGPTLQTFPLPDSSYAKWGQPCLCPGSRDQLVESAGGELSVPSVPSSEPPYGSGAGNGSISSGYPGYIGASGTGPCVGVVVYCPDTDTVYTYHLGVGINRAGTSFRDHGKGCHAVLCQGKEGIEGENNPDSRIARCLLKNTIAMLKSQGVTIDGFIAGGGCYIGPDKKWYGVKVK